MLRRLLLFLGTLGLLASSLGATWSIVVVNRRTGEVCVASATCLPRTDLTVAVPVIVVGKGAAAHQSVIDITAENRQLTFEGLMQGLSPQEILDLVAASDEGYIQRQIGIVDFDHDPVSYTGRGAGGAKKSVTGASGDLVYAIQGNVLAGRVVVDQTEDALLTSTGDLGQRVLAAMVRAREYGGDGRCSCEEGAPDSCGAPPEEFEKSAHVGFMLVARIGDVDGVCTPADGCATGSYYLRLNVRGVNGLPDDPDPVDQLVERYAAWRSDRLGRPDGLLSRVSPVGALPADGITTRIVTVQLVDLDGHELDHGGASIAVVPAEGSPALFAIGPVVDHGDGSYSFPAQAGTETGTEALVITARDELVRATLHPFLELRADPVSVLHAGFDRVSASGAEAVPFVVNQPERPRARFWLLASLGGKKSRGPGFDPALRSVLPAGAPFFPGPPGRLDGSGRAEVTYRAPDGALLPLIGMRLEWTARIVGHGPPLESNTVGFEIGP